MGSATAEKVSLCITRCRQSRKLVLVIVFIALFLDNMLLTTIVPIIPSFLDSLEHPTKGNNLPFVGENKLICQNLSREIINTSSVNEGAWNYVFGFPTHYVRDRHHQYAVCFNQSSNVVTNLTADASVTITPERHTELSDENVEVGLMFASKAIMQLIANPFIGPLTNRIGYSIPMFTGFVLMMISTIIFAFGQNFSVLIIARTVQGIGSACSSVSGMGMLAEYYPDDRERGNAMGIALGGLAMGVLVGPPFGGVMYQFVGKEAPFLILAFLAMFDGCLQMLALQPSMKPESQEGASLKKLLKDPYILVAAGCITFANMGIAMMEPSLPLWMIETMGATEWQQGIAFLPASISYLIGTNIFGVLAHRMGRWLSAMVGMVVISICLVAIPFSKNLGHLVAPNFGLGFAIGMVDSAMMPLMGYLVDLRHVSVYGSVYAIADVAFCLGFAIGPALSGTIVKHLNFQWMLFIIAMINLAYAPLLFFLRNPPGKEEKQSLILNDQCPVQYVTYNQTGKSNDNTDDEDGIFGQ